jgi:hypothetical protein
MTGIQYKSHVHLKLIIVLAPWVTNIAFRNGIRTESPRIVYWALAIKEILFLVSAVQLLFHIADVVIRVNNVTSDICHCFQLLGSI